MIADSTHHPDDASLLADWLRAPSSGARQAAFAALARRYSGLIYHAALRATGQPGLAEEATQNTLALLARKAGSLDASRPLAPWLHRTACWQASVLGRRERRHLHRIEKMATLHDDSLFPPDADPAAWAAARPHLDAAINSLAESDRQVLLMKYFDGCTFEEMSRRLGGQSAAWRQRGSRALQRLRNALSRRGCSISAVALTAGLSSVLTTPAPAALFTALATSSTLAASGKLSWTTLAAHSLKLMTAKQILTTAAILSALLAPLGIQYRATVGTRARVQALTTSVEALRTAVGPASDSVTRSGGRPAPVAGSTAGEGIDLAAWAEIFSKGGPATASEMARILGIVNTLKSLDAESFEGLILAAQQMDLPPAKRMKLLMRLLPVFDQKFPGAALPFYVRLAANATGGDAVNITGHAGAALARWMAEDPDAADAWFVRERDAGAFATKTLIPYGTNALAADPVGSSFASTLQQQRIVGLMKSRPEAVELELKSMSPQEAAAALGKAGTSFDPAFIARLAALLPVASRHEAVRSTVWQLARTGDLNAVVRTLNSSGVSDHDRHVLLVDAANTLETTGPGGRPDWEEVKNRSAWLRRQSPEGEADAAVGTFLASLARHDLQRGLDAYRTESVNPVLTGAFARRLGIFSPGLFKTAMTMAEAMPAGAEQDRALSELKALPYANQPTKP